MPSPTDRPIRSLPTWERGSKQRVTRARTWSATSLPTWERGSKPAVQSRRVGRALSLPTWERGSKLLHDRGDVGLRRRSPRGSVDRNIDATWMGMARQVAPHVGAWIETSPRTGRRTDTRSLPTWERGSKLSMAVDITLLPRRSPRGSVDRNRQTIVRGSADSGRSPRGSVDRNRRYLNVAQGQPGRSPRGSVDRNYDRALTIAAAQVAPHVGAWIETDCGLSQCVCYESLPTWERGSKHRQAPPVRPRPRRSPRGSEDRNPIKQPPAGWKGVAPHVGAWIETSGAGNCAGDRRVAPHVGAWIETRQAEQPPPGGPGK